MRKNFLSVLSQFDKGMVQVPTEESNSADLKLAEALLPDEASVDDAIAGKPKEKQGKDGRGVKRLTTVCPDPFGLVMGFLSVPISPQPNLSVDTALHAPGMENAKGIDSASAACEELPETKADKSLTCEHNFLAGNLPMPPLPDASGRIQIVQDKERLNENGQRTEPALDPEQFSSKLEYVPAVDIKVSQLFQGRQKSGTALSPESELALKSESVLPADLSDTVRVQAVPAKGLPKETGRRSEPPLPLDLVSSEQALVPAKDTQVSQVSQGQLYQGLVVVPDSELVLQADLSDTVRVQAVPAKGLPKETGRRSEPPLPLDLVSSEQALVPAKDTQVSQVSQRQLYQGSVMVPDSELVLQADFSDTVRVQAVPAKGLPKETGWRSEPPLPLPLDLVSSEQVLVPAEDIQVSQVFQGRIEQVSVMVPDSELVLQAALSETDQAQSVPEHGLTREREQRYGPLSIPVPDLSDAGLANTDGVKESRSFQRYLQPDAVKIPVSERVSKADLSDTDRAQAVPARVTPESHRQQNRDFLTIPDKVILNQEAGNNNSDVKGDTPLRLSEDKFLNGSISEKAPTDKKSDPGRHDAVKGKSASFFLPKILSKLAECPRRHPVLRMPVITKPRKCSFPKTPPEEPWRAMKRIRIFRCRSRNPEICP